MLFNLNTTRYFYTEEEIDKLKDLGFEFTKTLSPYREKGRFILDEPTTVNIDTLEQLMEFIGKYGTIVLNPDEIEIYNGCRE